MPPRLAHLALLAGLSQEACEVHPCLSYLEVDAAPDMGPDAEPDAGPDGGALGDAGVDGGPSAQAVPALDPASILARVLPGLPPDVAARLTTPRNERENG